MNEGDDDPPMRGALPAVQGLVEAGLVRQVAMRSVISRVLGRSEGGVQLGPYRLAERVGEGGMGVVFRGVDQRSGAAVAVKVLSRGDARARGRFVRETETLRSIDHPHVVRYLDHGTTPDGSDYLVMEWLDGEDLESALGRGPLPVESVARLGHDAALALARAHAEGVLHRDVKPRNLFLVGGSHEALRVIDFGIARVPREGARLTATGEVLGTPVYMAPEQIRGHDSPRTDVYGLGATLFQCLTGSPPFTGAHDGEVLLNVLTEPSPSARTRRADVPRGLDALVGRMLAKNPDDRPPDMRAVAAELAELVAGSPGPRESSPGIGFEEPRPSLDRRAPSANPVGPDLRFVGRSRELGTLLAILDECVLERAISVARIVGEAGLGKTALLARLRERATAAHPGLSFLVLDCASDAPSSALSALAYGIDAWLANPSFEPRASLVRVARALDEVRNRAAAVPISELVSLSDRLRIAWVELARELLERGPVVVIVDGAESLDLGSARYLGRLLDVASPNGRSVVLSGRPSLAMAELPEPFARHTIHEVALEPLRAPVAEQLARVFAPDLEESRLAEVVARAHGVPGELRLALDPASGGRPDEARSLPDVRSRIGALDPDRRRILRAVAVLDSPCPRSLVAVLTGTDRDTPQLEERLDSLVRERLLERRPGPFHEASYAPFGEASRRASLELVTEADRRHVHRLVATWAIVSGRMDARAIAEHFLGAGSPERSLPHFEQAARVALASGELELADRTASRALEVLGETGSSSALLGVRAECAFFRGAHAEAEALAQRAARARSIPDAAYFDAMGLVASARGQQGKNDEVRLLIEDLLASDVDDASREARLSCLARAACQLLGAAHPSASSLAEAIAALPRSGHRHPIATAWTLRIEAFRAIDRGFDAMLDVWSRTYGAFLHAGDPRTAVSVQISLGSFHVWAGDFERAFDTTEAAEALAMGLDSPFLVRWAAYTRGKALAEGAPYREAKDHLLAVAASLEGSPRMQAGAWLYLALAAIRASEPREAIEWAERALRTHDAPSTVLPARACSLLARLSTAPADELATEARALSDLLTSSARLPEFEALVRLSVVRGLFAGGRRAEAERRLGEALAWLEERGSTLSDPFARSRFHSRPHANAELHRTRDLLSAAPLA